jgi:hypothetical protein
MNDKNPEAGIKEMSRGSCQILLPKSEIPPLHSPCGCFLLSFLRQAINEKRCENQGNTIWKSKSSIGEEG